VDDFPGRRAGAQCGPAVWALARRYFDGSVLQTPLTLRLTIGTSAGAANFPTLRGFSYQLQSTPDLSQPFAAEANGSAIATDTATTITIPTGSPRKFYRVISSATP
jgi:hypothetical protein